MKNDGTLCEVRWLELVGWTRRCISSRLQRTSLHRAERWAQRLHDGALRGVRAVRADLLSDDDLLAVIEDRVHREVLRQHCTGKLPLDDENLRARLAVVVRTACAREANHRAATAFPLASEVEQSIPGPTVEELVANRERIRKGVEVVNKLPRGLRETMRLVIETTVVGETATDEDLAERLGIAPATARKRLERARELLRHIVDGTPSSPMRRHRG